MHSNSTRPTRSGRVALVIEIEIPREGAMDWVRLLTSIPGREGTLSRVWTTKEGRMDSGAWTDLQSAVNGQLDHALQMLGGVQQVLDL